MAWVKQEKSQQQMFEDDNWSVADLEALQRMICVEKRSYRDIGRVLKKTVGQIAGKCHKYGWTAGNRRVGSSDPAGRVKVRAARSKVAAQAAKGLQVKLRKAHQGKEGMKFKSKPIEVKRLDDKCGVVLLELHERGCRFAVGERGDTHLFCGEVSVTGSSYCSLHSGMVTERSRSAPNAGNWRLR